MRASCSAISAYSGISCSVILLASGGARGRRAHSSHRALGLSRRVRIPTLRQGTDRTVANAARSHNVTTALPQVGLGWPQLFLLAVALALSGLVWRLVSRRREQEALLMA